MADFMNPHVDAPLFHGHSHINSILWAAKFLKKHLLQKVFSVT